MAGGGAEGQDMEDEEAGNDEDAGGDDQGPEEQKGSLWRGLQVPEEVDDLQREKLEVFTDMNRFQIFRKEYIDADDDRRRERTSTKGGKAKGEGTEKSDQGPADEASPRPGSSRPGSSRPGDGHFDGERDDIPSTPLSPHLPGDHKSAGRRGRKRAMTPKDDADPLATPMSPEEADAIPEDDQDADQQPESAVNLKGLKSVRDPSNDKYFDRPERGRQPATPVSPGGLGNVDVEDDGDGGGGDVGDGDGGGDDDEEEDEDDSFAHEAVGDQPDEQPKDGNADEEADEEEEQEEPDAMPKETTGEATAEQLALASHYPKVGQWEDNMGDAIPFLTVDLLRGGEKAAQGDVDKCGRLKLKLRTYKNRHRYAALAPCPSRLMPRLSCFKAI
jgi:hypothetical protein